MRVGLIGARWTILVKTQFTERLMMSRHYCPVISRIVSIGYDKHFPDLGQKSWKVPEK